jgi:hypothetical protein
MPLLKNKEHYTYAEYLTWPDDERWEIIGGIAYAMTPSPGVNHQEILLHLGSILRAHLAHQPCRVFVSALDVV